MISKFDGTNYDFLSNFYPADVIYDGLVYPTVEHGMQAAKTINLLDREKIRLAKTPAEAKRIGRKVQMREGWDDVKIAIVADLIRQKFTPGSALAAKLAQTLNKELIEGNHWHDCIWGICSCSRCGSTGSNVLGQLLMHVRKENRDGVRYPLNINTTKIYRSDI